MLWRRFHTYLDPSRGLVAVTVFLVLVSPLVGAALLWLLKLVVDEVLVGGQLALLYPYAVAYAALVGAREFVAYSQVRLEAAVGERVVLDLRRDLYAHLLALSPGSLRDRGAGDLIAHLSGDVPRVESLVFTAVLTLIDDLAHVAVFLTVLFLLSWKLTLLSLVVVPLLALAAWRYAPRLRRADRVTRRHEGAWMTLAETTLNAVAVVQAFSAGRQETSRFAAACDCARRSELRSVRIQAVLSLLIEVAAAVGTLVLVMVGAGELSRGALTIGTLAAFLGSLGSLYGPIRGLARAAARFQRAAVGAQRVATLLDTPSRVREAAPHARPLPRQVRGRIAFEGVRFAYDACGGAEVLRGIDLVIEPGETVALVGASGGGKSTLVQLLPRLYDPTHGTVRIDGIDLREVALGSLRRSVGVVFQEPHLLRTTIAANIAYGADAGTRALPAIEAAARAAHAHGFIARLPSGYARLLGTRGDGLSGGQKQRLALARALVREPPILVLDEATASVDGETEALMQATLERLAGRSTILVVAHRLAAVRRADRIVVVEEGRIVESGPPARLLELPSRCRALFESQLEPRVAAS